MKDSIVKCCMNCKFYHFFNCKCEKKGKMPPVDLELPCEDFIYKGGKDDGNDKS